MIRIMLAAALILATPAFAQGEGAVLDPAAPPAAMKGTLDLDLSLPDIFGSSEPDREINGCIVPGRPDWVWQMDPKLTAKRGMVNALYNLRWSEAVVAQNDCSCAVRFPDWKNVIEEFQANYVRLDRQEMFDTQMSYRSRHHQKVAQARAICREQSQ